MIKRQYYQCIQIDQNLISSFIKQHPKIGEFIKEDAPFNVRIWKKPYPGLLHAIISQNETNENVMLISSQLDIALKDKITPNKLLRLSDNDLLTIFKNEHKVNLIKEISLDIKHRKLNLRRLNKLSSKEIINKLSQYSYITIQTIKEYLLFTCYKSDVLCTEDLNFLIGLSKYLKVKSTREYIPLIEKEFKNQETLFTLCMWKIRFMKDN